MQGLELPCRVRSKVRIESGLLPDPMCKKWSVQKKNSNDIVSKLAEM